MEFPELSLAPTHAVNVNKSRNGFPFEYSDTNASRKRKLFQDHLLMKTHEPALQASVDLQLKDPLPLDWEQCLDLEVNLSISLSHSIYIYVYLPSFNLV